LCNFRPFNKHILIKHPEVNDEIDTSPVLLPPGAKTTDNERYGVVEFICAAPDCDRFLRKLNPDEPSWATHDGLSDDAFIESTRGKSVGLVVDKSMIEDVTIDNKEFHVVHQNYVVGVVKE